MGLQTAAEMDIRVRHIADLISKGGKRSDCLQYAAAEWGIKTRSADELIARARVLIREDWQEIQRDQMMAEILSQYSSLQLEAREQGQLHVALGCIHGAAKLAQLVV
jgi:hypothetical protein